MLRPPRHPLFWLCGFVLWFAVLWLLSSSRPALPEAVTIPFLDKIAHFGYFLGGGGMLTAYLYRRQPSAPNWQGLIALSVSSLALIGGLDEFHQTFTPGRSGNDCGDWLADVLGALAGGLVLKRCHPLLKDG